MVLYFQEDNISVETIWQIPVLQFTFSIKHFMNYLYLFDDSILVIFQFLTHSVRRKISLVLHLKKKLFCS